MYVIVNIIKLKRIHGLNYMSFGEQRLVSVIKKYTVDIACHAQL